jgi:hypothetical protein
MIRLAPVGLSGLVVLATLRSGLRRAPGDAATWWAAAAVLLVLGLIAGWLIFAERRPTRAAPPEVLFHTRQGLVLELAAALASLLMLALGSMALVDSATRPDPVLGLVVGLACLPFGALLVLFRTSVIIDPERRVIRRLYGRPRALFQRQVPFSAVRSVELIEVVNRYGHPRGWHVAAQLGEGAPPLVLCTSFGEAAARDAARRIRALLT